MTDTTGSESLRQRAMEVREQLLGPDRAQAQRSFEDIAPDFGRITEEVLMAQIWARPGMDLRTRCLCTVTALLATERYDYARVHLYTARRQGVSRDELCELALQLLFYAGITVSRTALQMIKEVFDDPETEPPRV